MNIFHDILKQYWGYDSFRSLQEEIIASVSEGKDTLGLMPTGGGKSLTFQVPTLAMEGLCIVITPLIALMKDQVDNLKQRGIKAAVVHSGMNRQEIIIALENCIFGNYKFLYVSPERLNTELFLSKLQHMQVCLIAVDESHCISQWGYDFRPSYLQIAQFREKLPGVPVLALTATATPDVIDDIQDKLLFKEKNVFRKSFERKNIAYIVRETEDKLFETIKILKNVPGSGIVYVRSRKRTKEIARELDSQGIQADYFHAGLNPEEKIQKQNRWKSGECRIIACTNAFGMGIDKPDVRVVVHFEIPSSLEEYFQEAGRAGRDEQKAYAVALFSTSDKTKLKKRIGDEFPERKLILDVYEKLSFFFQVAMHSGGQTGHDFRIEPFCHTFKFSLNQVHYALKILELAGHIEYIEDSEKQSKLIFTVHRDDLYHLSNFDPGTENLIQILLRSYTGLFADYVYISEHLLSTRSGLSPHEVYERLKHLSGLHVVHYVPAKNVPTVYYTHDREELKDLMIPRSVYEDRLKKLESRISNVIQYVTDPSVCRSQFLLNYFGEKKSGECGHCDVCLARKKREPDNEVFHQIESEILKFVSDTSIEIDGIVRRLPFPEQQVLEVIRFLSDHKKILVKGNLIKNKP